MGYICMSQGVKVRAALATAITRKAISLTEISAENTADVVGFMANDLGKVYDGMQVRLRHAARPLLHTARLLACSLARLRSAHTRAALLAGVPLPLDGAVRGGRHHRAPRDARRHLGAARARHRGRHHLPAVLLRLADRPEQVHQRRQRQ